MAVKLASKGNYFIVTLEDGTEKIDYKSQFKFNRDSDDNYSLLFAGNALISKQPLAYFHDETDAAFADAATFEDFVFSNTGGVNFNTGGVSPSTPTDTEELYCIARLPTGGATWELVSDANHESSASVDGITTAPSAGYNFAINHNNGYSKVGSFLATVDETYANMGLFIGGSVGKTQSLFKICRNGFSIRIVGSANSLGFSNDTGQIVKNTDFTFTFDTVTGLLTIEHPTIVCTYGDMGLLTIQDPCPYIARFVARTPTTTSFKMFNNGVLVTALSSTFKAYYTKLGTFACLDPQIGQSAANFWLRGIMKK